MNVLSPHQAPVALYCHGSRYSDFARHSPIIYLLIYFIFWVVCARISKIRNSGIVFERAQDIVTRCGIG